MFIRQPIDSPLAFIRSINVKAFPCGRRRSTLIDSDGNEATTLDRYYIPFDPESRLNTEANNRKHSGLNGYKQNYLYDWDIDHNKLVLVLGGYSFDIKLDEGFNTPALFGKALEELFVSADKIYANIRVDNVEFFSGGSGIPAAATEVLRNQTATDAPSTSLDILIDYASIDSPDSYFFSGLSFSTSLITDENLISMCILEKTGSGWKIHEPARLPLIDHGSSENSVKMTTLEVDRIVVNGTEQATSIKLVKTASGAYQLQFMTD